jgi:hypothetical protein
MQGRRTTSTSRAGKSLSSSTASSGSCDVTGRTKPECSCPACAIDLLKRLGIKPSVRLVLLARNFTLRVRGWTEV